MDKRPGDFADVAVPLPINQLFTYAVPEPLSARVRPGWRVVVPFGNRTLTGIAVRRHNDAVVEVKAICDVLGDSPLIDTALLKLGAWLSSYYLCPPGEVFRVMLPPGLLSRQHDSGLKTWPVKKRLAVVEVADVADSELPTAQAKLWRFLQQERASLPMLLAAVTSAGYGQSVIKALVAKKIIRLEPVEVSRSPWSATHVVEGEVRKHTLNEEQQKAYGRIEQAIGAGSFASILLHGVTGSGKTEVYLHAISAALGAGKTALMLVPEIGLTPQVARYFRSWFGDRAAILHSGLSDGERFDQWRRIRDGEASVAIGTRSAVFAPLSNLGLIVVDEEHDGSYKQEEMPRYNARDTALKRGQIENVAVVLGSATPQLETYHLAVRKHQHEYVPLLARVEQRALASVTVVDMRVEFQKHGRGAIISEPLKEAIQARLDSRQQVLVLLNRRGYSPLLLCRSCGFTEACENCSISLTYHQRNNILSCHYCGFVRPVPKSCRNCGKEYIYFLGEGTEKIEEIIGGLFPGATVGRLDRDTVQKRGSMVRILKEFARGHIDILVGTQMIAKGHDFPRVTLVGVLSAEQSLRIADFRAAERTFQLLTQVAGRSGRGEQPGEVVVQTFFPNHYSLKYASAQDYDSFWRHEVQYRYRFRYPPFTALANLLIAGRDRAQVSDTAADLHRELLRRRQELSDPARMNFLGPAPAAREKLKSEYRFQVLVKATSRSELHDVIEKAVADVSREKGKAAVISVDIDPITLF